MIRNLTELDLPEVVNLENLAHSFPWSQAIFEQCLKAGCQGWVLEEEARIKGFIFLTLQNGECHILNIVVHPAFQNRGLGQALLLYALKAAKQKNIQIAYLEVRQSNSHAINLYEKSDFVEMGERKNYYQTKTGYEDAIVFAKDLRIDESL
jgi:[ribosomal protein S18]-alanine N-acetyltransferase